MEQEPIKFSCEQPVASDFVMTDLPYHDQRYGIWDRAYRPCPTPYCVPQSFVGGDTTHRKKVPRRNRVNWGRHLWPHRGSAMQYDNLVFQPGHSSYGVF